MDKETNNLNNEPSIDCSVCLNEIPESGGLNSETHDYVQNYCGLDCYKEWQEKQQEQKK